MNDGYNCYQNALVERINGILKKEFLFYKCNNGYELRKLIKESIQIYNTKRPHLSLNMKTPGYIYKKIPEKLVSLGFFCKYTQEFSYLNSNEVFLYCKFE